MNFWDSFNKVKRAHQYFLAFILSMPTFLSVLYDSYLTKIPLLVRLFPSLERFVLVFAVVYIPSMLALGEYYFENKKGRPKREEAKRDMMANPWMMDMTQAVIYIAQGQNDKAVELLEREWL